LPVLLLIACKLNALNLAFHWDEAWVYAPAVIEMSSDMPSLLSGSIDIELSRGHPLLFHFLGGVWGNIFGTSLISLHTFGLAISCLLVVALQYVVHLFSNKWFGCLAGILIVLQEMFFAQSAFVFPEILLSLTVLLTLYFYSTGKWVLYSISLLAAFLTKETAVILLPALFLFELFNLLNRDADLKDLMTKFLYTIIPIAVVFLHFLYQKVVFGWWLFPEHVDLISTDLFTIKNAFRNVWEVTLHDQGRFYPIMLAYGIFVVTNRNCSRLIKIIVLVLILISISIVYAKEMSGFGNGLLFSMLLLPLLYSFPYKQKGIKNSKSVYLRLSLLLIVMFLLFSSMNFYTNRYSLVCIPLIVSFISIALFQLSKQNKALAILATCIAIGPFAYNIYSSDEEKEISYGYVNKVKVAKMAIHHIEELATSENITVNSGFVISSYLFNNNCGYVENKSAPFTRAGWSSSDYIITTNFESSKKEFEKYQHLYQLVNEFHLGRSWSRVYKKKEIE